jgi:hypothetical protein
MQRYIAQTPVSFGLIISDHHFLEHHFDQNKRICPLILFFSFSGGLSNLFFSIAKAMLFKKLTNPTRKIRNRWFL